MQLKIDHITVCGADLEAMRQAFRRAGLPSEYGGPHANGVTHMASVRFEDGSYLELIAPLRPSAKAAGTMAGWAKFMEGSAGPSAWAVESANIQADTDRLRVSGIQVRGPDLGGRTRPDGTVLEWETALLGDGPAGSVLPFMIQDKTARSLRVQPSPGFQSSDLLGVAAVAIGVHDLAARTALFRQAYHWDTPSLEEDHVFGATLASFRETPVVLAAPPDDKDSWLRSRLDQFGECPAGFLLRTRSIENIAKRILVRPSGNWFGRTVAWFDPAALGGTRLGVIEWGEHRSMP